jgi:hypothetical protein
MLYIALTQDVIILVHILLRSAPVQRNMRGREAQMSLLVWIPGMFCLGLALMAICLWFVRACEKI